MQYTVYTFHLFLSFDHFYLNLSAGVFFLKWFSMIADKNRKIAYVVLDPKVVFFSNFQRTLGLSSWTDLRCMISSTNNQATGWSDSSSSPSRDLITKFNLKEFFKPIQKSMPFYNGQKILKLFNLQTIICSRLLFGSYTIILENLSEWGKWYIYHL